MQGVLGAFHEIDAAVDAIEDLKKERFGESRCSRRRRATSSSTR